MAWSLLADLVARGLDATDGLLVVIDGRKTFAAAVREVFGAKATVHYCTLHKRRNVTDHLPEKGPAWVDTKLVEAFANPDPEQDLHNSVHLAGQLDKAHPLPRRPSGYAGLEEMFTVARLGIDARLGTTLTTSNPIKSMISIARATNRDATRWRHRHMVCRCTAAGMLGAERSFRRVKHHKQMPRHRTSPTRPPPMPTKTPKLSVMPTRRVHHGIATERESTRPETALSPRFHIPFRSLAGSRLRRNTELLFNERGLVGSVNFC